MEERRSIRATTSTTSIGGGESRVPTHPHHSFPQQEDHQHQHQQQHKNRRNLSVVRGRERGENRSDPSPSRPPPDTPRSLLYQGRGGRRETASSSPSLRLFSPSSYLPSFPLFSSSSFPKFSKSNGHIEYTPGSSSILSSSSSSPDIPPSSSSSSASSYFSPFPSSSPQLSSSTSSSSLFPYFSSSRRLSSALCLSMAFFVILLFSSLWVLTHLFTSSRNLSSPSPFSFSSLFHSSSPSSSSSSISKIDQDKKKTSTVTTIVKYTGNSPLLRGVHVGSSSSSLSEEGEQGEEEERLSSSSKVGRKKESSGALSLSSSSSSLHSPYDPTCSSPSSSSYPCSFLLIADLDGNSRVESPFLSSSDLLFKSYILKAKLYVHPTSRVSPSSHSPQSSPSPSFFLSSDYHIEFEEIKETDGYRQEDQEKQEKDTSSSPPPVYHQILYGKHNEGGRGLELSELIYFNRELLTFDDRTGIVYKLSLQTKKLIAKYLLVEGDGVSSSKGMKIEWATVKDDLLYVGSFGKEFTDSSGEIVHYHNVWIAVIDRQGQITRQDWAEPYRRIREAVGAAFPGYVIHEAINWSSHLHRWVVLPRRISAEPYDDVLDEERGSSKLLLCSEDFREIKVIHIRHQSKEKRRARKKRKMMEKIKEKKSVDKKDQIPREDEEDENGPNSDVQEEKKKKKRHEDIPHKEEEEGEKEEEEEEKEEEVEDKRRGFSSFKFIPGTQDQVILALKSVENSSLNLQESYLTIFDVEGNVLLPDLRVPHACKYEGLEFIPHSL